MKRPPQLSVPRWTIERLAPWIAGAVLALPVLVAHYPPMVDLPLHEAVVGLLRHWGDPAFVPPNVYRLNLGFANQLFYFLIFLLAYVVPIGTASKLVVAAALFAFPFAVARLAGHLGATRLTALFVAPLGLGWTFFWGLVANMIGLDLYLFALPSLDRFAQRPTARGALKTCALLVVLHFAHGLVALVAAATVVLFALPAWWKRTRASAWCVVPVIFAAGLAATTTLAAGRGISKFHDSYPTLGWGAPPLERLADLPGVLYSTAGGERWVCDLVFAACQIPIVAFAVERWRARSRRVRTPTEWLHDLRFVLLGGALVALYFFGPADSKMTTKMHYRFLPIAWVILSTWACSAGALAGRRSMRLVALLAPLVPLLVSWPRFVDSDQTYRDLDAAIDRMRPGSSYAILDMGPTKEYEVECPGCADGHIVARLGGRSFFDYTLSELAPVFQRVSVQWDEVYERVGWVPHRWIPAWDMTRYHYVVVHSTNMDLANIAVLALEPEGKLVFHRGEWTVMESTLPMVPLDSPDAPVPVPSPEPFRDRVLAVGARLQALAPEQRRLPLEP